MSGAENNIEDKFKLGSFDILKMTKAGKDSYRVLVPNAVAVIALTDDGKILLTKEFRKATEKVETFLPAGREKDIDVTSENAARRELREESGFDAQEIEFFMETKSKVDWYSQKKTAFIARGLFPSPLVDEDDTGNKPELYACTPDEVRQLLRTGQIDDDLGYILYRFLDLYYFNDNSFEIANVKNGQNLAAAMNVPGLKNV